MSGVFHKAILKVSDYHSPDGRVSVTKQRLKHWANEIGRLQRAGYTIPMHFDHGKDLESMSPVRLDLNDKTRSASNTVGKLKDFKVAKDGLSAEITVETLTPSATEKVKSNAVFVSPVIMDSWTDGANNRYSDIITSVDLVDHPVDHSQGPFYTATPEPICCALRMSATTQIYRLSENPNVENEDQEMPTEETPEATPEGSSTSVADVLAELAKLNIILPDDTTEANFLDRLRPALMTAAAQSGMTDQAPTEDPSEPPKAVDPAIATMSLRVKQLEGHLLEQGRAKAADRMRKILETGRCTPAEYDSNSKALKAVKMSLGSDNTVSAGTIEHWMASRESIPSGSCWSPEEKLLRMGSRPVDAPTAWTQKQQPDVEELRRQKREMLRQS
jgi:hypothetical protein